MEIKTNTIENIIASSKTLKEAAHGMTEFASKIGFEFPTDMGALLFVKRFKNQDPGAGEVATQIRAAELQYNRRKAIDWLLKNQPMDMINNAIQETQKAIEVWAAQMVKDPFYSFRWANDIAKKVAQLRAYQEIKEGMTYLLKTETGLTAKTWEKLVADLTSKVISGAAYPPSSTSKTDNLMQSLYTAALADIIRNDDFYIRDITWYYRKWERYQSGGY